MDADLSPVAIADDGELEDVRRLLGKLGVDFVDAWTGEAPSAALRISNPRRALEASDPHPTDLGGHRPFHIVILDEESAQIRQGLKTGQFDFIVQRPVHPAALRLLILHALYSGPEKRSTARVAMDADVQLGSGLIPRAAKLTQLSEKGCGILSDKKVDVGERTTVVLPRTLTGDRPLPLEGRVVASLPFADADSREYEISIAFRPPDASVKQCLRKVMVSHGIGAASLRPRRARPKPQRAASAPSASKARSSEEKSSSEKGSPDERRRSPRKSYRRPVLASAKGAVHTLIGRDLSTGGMRVAADERLRAGDEFKIVIYGHKGRAPVLVKAVVARNDGENGCALQFRDVGTTVAASLEEMVRSLPQLSGGEGANVVLSEIIEDA